MYIIFSFKCNENYCFEFTLIITSDQIRKATHRELSTSTISSSINASSALQLMGILDT